jgi:tetratricopeptide (TPR) repeat protein
MRGGLAARYFTLGDWDRAMALADEFIAEIEAGSPHYLEGLARTVRSWICLGRDELGRAAEESEKALAIGRNAKDPQAVRPALITRAQVLHASGRSDEARALLDELATAWRESPGTPRPIGADAAALFADVGRADEFSPLLKHDEDSILWHRAARMVLAGRPEEAVAIYAEMGAASSEAYARLRAAAKFVAEGRRAAADEHLGKALAFHRSVGAKRYVAEGEALLAASA